MIITRAQSNWSHLHSVVCIHVVCMLRSLYIYLFSLPHIARANQIPVWDMIITRAQSNRSLLHSVVCIPLTRPRELIAINHEKHDVLKHFHKHWIKSLTSLYIRNTFNFDKTRSTAKQTCERDNHTRTTEEVKLSWDSPFSRLLDSMGKARLQWTWDIFLARGSNRTR